MKIFHGRQLKAARVLAALTVLQLAEAAGVTARTVHRLEVGGQIAIASKRRHGHVSRATWDKIAEALCGHGVELTPESEAHGPGVRWIAASSPQRLRADYLADRQDRAGQV